MPFAEAVPIVLDEEEIGQPPFDGREGALVLRAIQVLRLTAEQQGVTI